MGRLVSVFFLLCLFFGGLFLLRPKALPLDSPVPKVFGSSKSQIINNWFPKGKKEPDETLLSLSAKSVLAVNYENGDVLFENNINEKLPVASTVKIMTALVVLENVDVNSIFTVTDKAAKVGENSMGLTAGEKLTVKELLYGLMLVSGNDSAVTLAEGVSGTEEKFVEMMNEKVQSLGLKNTKFINASGLDEDGKVQYSTAYDLAVISHYVWENYPMFRDISSTFHQFIDSTNRHKEFDLYNDTNLLTTYPGVMGIKPGFTWEAGLCLVTYAENDGKKIIAVILGSENRRGEMKELLDYSFSQYGITVFHPALDL